MHPEQVAWLLTAGANPAAKDSDGKSVSEHIAERQIIYGHRVVSEKLLAQAIETLQLKDQMKKDAALAAELPLSVNIKAAGDDQATQPLSLLSLKTRER